jgi:hypothetical protein
MHFGSLIAAAGTLAIIASAQTPPSSPNKPARNKSGLVRPIPGAPLSVEVIEERLTKNSDGTSTSETDKTMVYRDDAGRLRSEEEIRDPVDGPVPLIILADPVEGFVAILETSTKVAHRLQGPKDGTRFAIMTAGFGGRGLIDVPGEKTRKSENLGAQTIEGIEFQGARTTTTSNEQPSLRAIDELWMSKDLGLIGLGKYSGPDGEITARIQKRAAPDPTLFVIPADYRIRDMEP